MRDTTTTASTTHSGEIERSTTSLRSNESWSPALGDAETNAALKNTCTDQALRTTVAETTLFCDIQRDDLYCAYRGQYITPAPPISPPAPPQPTMSTAGSFAGDPNDYNSQATDTHAPVRL